MKAIIIAAVAAIGLGYGAYVVLEQNQQKADSAFATSGARVGDPGHNLVGKNWYDGRGS
jgi:hypothetical protein